MVGIYRRLLHLYPPSFRARFGEEMLQFVRDDAAHGRRVRWLRTFVDLFGSAAVQRWEAREMTPKVGLAVVVVVISAAATFLFTGTEITVPAVLLFATILAGVALIVGVGIVLGRRGAEHAYRPRGFRWWWVPAAILGAGQFAFGFGQLISDPKATNVVALLIYSAFSALVFCGMAIRNRTSGNYMIAVGVLPIGSIVWWIFPPVLALIVVVNAIAENVRMTRAQPAV